MTDNKKHDTKLSSTVTVSQYRKFEEEGNKTAIINFVVERFTERFISPLKRNTKHGFCMMAVNCLMIETLACFRQGWVDTKPKDSALKAFKFFFGKNEGFKDFRQYAKSFYEDVRCGILHQAETKNGWRIIRRGDLFVPATKTINATKFQIELEKALKNYGELLDTSEWNEERGVWANFRKKMDVVCKNCD